MSSTSLVLDSPLDNSSEPVVVLPVERLLEGLLREQQRTAVDRFAQWHEKTAEPLQARFYRDLIPTSKPRSGEQYAFDVDLDACSGCKACVTACHTLNGLEDEELWRAVGLLHGGSQAAPVLQHVTTACHHCVEPACLEGCPVDAYEKDPDTGIVRHLDDQCIGCQYCILKCPYDVPKYSPSKGIVRKCDMCSDRLAAGEAPACVQACPNQAIRIAIVNKQEVVENAEANLFLPGAPEPSITLPSTIYHTRRALPANLLPSDYYAAAPQRAHWPLIWMLVLTQMSVGAFLVDQVLSGLALANHSETIPLNRTWHLGAAFVLGLIGLGASTLHLGRPWLAYRAIIGWRTSWLSREVIAFGIFAASTSAYATIPWLERLGIEVSMTLERALGAMVAASGLAGVACSTMIYASTRRDFWNAPYTGLKFLLTTLLLGIPAALLVRAASSTESAGSPVFAPEQVRALCMALMAVAAVKLLAELVIFAWLKSPTITPLRRTALLLTGDLRRVTTIRFAAGACGGILLPAIFAAAHSTLSSSLGGAWWGGALAIVLGLNLIGEILERFLFFAAVVAPKMPGAPAT